MDSEKLLKLLPELQALAGQLPAIEELLARAPAEVRDKIKPIEEFPERKRRQSEIQALVIDHIWAKAQANSRKDADNYWRVSVKRVTDKVGGTVVGDAFDILLLGEVGIKTGDTLPAILSYFPSTGDHPDRWIGLSLGGLPPGTADHDILVWDETTDKTWKIRAFAGTADYDILYWKVATKEWKLLPFADAAYKVLQRKADGTLGWDWVRGH